VRARGDESAMAALYDRYSSLVYAVSLRVLGDTAAAEDAFAGNFPAALAKPAAFDFGAGEHGAWLS